MTLLCKAPCREAAASSVVQKEELSICDLGTGNAVLLVALAQLGYRRLTGTDYSAASIQLAGAVLAKYGLSDRVTLLVRRLRASERPYPDVRVPTAGQGSCLLPRTLRYSAGDCSDRLPMLRSAA